MQIWDCERVPHVEFPDAYSRGRSCLGKGNPQASRREASLAHPPACQGKLGVISERAGGLAGTGEWQWVLPGYKPVEDDNDPDAALFTVA